MTLKLKQRKGFLLIVFTIAFIIVSVILASVFFKAERIDQLRRETRTTQKMYEVMDGLLGNPFQILNPSGADITFLQQMGRFPLDMDEFLSQRYLQHFGMESPLYGPARDGFGNPLGFQSESGVFSISSSSLGENLSFEENLYLSNDLTFSVVDLVGEVLDETYFELTGNTTGLWSSNGNFVQGISFQNPFFILTNVVIGNYELRFYQSSGSTWIEDVLGPGNTFIRIPLWVHPGLGRASSNNPNPFQYVRLPFLI